jgi:Flp pilus assembly protein TadG
LALILPVWMLLVLACVDFGRVAVVNITLTNAARAGAAYAVMNPDIAGDLQQKVEQAARAEAEQQPGFDPARLTTVTTATVEPTGLRRVRVEATYDSFETLVPWPGVPHRVKMVRAVEMRAIR